MTPHSAWHRIGNWMPLAILGLVVSAGLAGVAGGDAPKPVSATGPAATLTMTTPDPLRSGMFFETRIEVVTRVPIARPTLAVSSSMWRNITINSHVPAAGSEDVKDGRFHFEYGALARGDRLDIKIDGQLNPSLVGVNRGNIVLLDGDRELVRLPARIRVLP